MTEESIFTEALNKHSPAERAAYLDDACAGDAALRIQVEALLRSHEEGGSFLAVPAGEQVIFGEQPPKSADASLSIEPTGAFQPPQDPVSETRSDSQAGDVAEDAPLDFLKPSEQAGSLGRLGHYEVKEIVGRGGMGVVLRAFDTKLHRIVAIKVMIGELAASATARRRFSREAQAAAAVCHEHVVTIHAVDEDHRPPYLVMQFVEGVSLQEKLDHQGVPGLREILRIGLQTAEGLAAAHKQGLVHRDIKPANILLENGVERVKITDFGLARAADDASLTQSGVIAGTPQYMSPEQAEGAAVDQRSDLFSLGSVLYATCTGRPPFRASSHVAVLKRVVEDDPRPIREINPDIPEWLCALIARLQAKDPAQRPSSAADVSAVLGWRLAELQQPASSLPSAVAQLESPAIPGPAPVPPAVPRSPSPDRRPVRVMFAVAAVSAVLLGTGLSEATGITHFTATIIRLVRPERTLGVESPQSQPVPALLPTPVALSPEDWANSVFHLPVEEQVRAFAVRLKELNAGFDGRVEATYKDGTVHFLKFCTDYVRDISPIRALRELAWLDAKGSEMHRGRLVDIGPLRSLRKLVGLEIEKNDVKNLEPLKGIRLTYLNLGFNPVEDLQPLSGMPLDVLQLWNTNVGDLSPLAGMPLHHLDLTVVPIRDLAPLKGMPLESISLGHTQVADLSPLTGMPLQVLHIDGTRVNTLDALKGMSLKVFHFPKTSIADVSLLKGMPLESVICDFQPKRDAAILRSLATLKRINSKPAADFWKEIDTRSDVAQPR